MSADHYSWVIAGDSFCVAANIVLGGWMLFKGSCKGISLKYQNMLGIVNFLHFIYNAGGNSLFIDADFAYVIVVNGLTLLESFALLYLMHVKFKKTVEKDYDTFWIEVPIILCGCLAIAYNSDADDPLNILFYASRYLESVSILPQIYFTFRTGSKKLCVFIYVLMLLAYKSMYIYYIILIKGENLFLDCRCTPTIYTLYPAFIQIGLYTMYFFMLIIVPKYKEEIQTSDADSNSGASTMEARDDYEIPPTPPSTIIVTRPQLNRQQSRLESPFLKKSLPSSNSIVNLNPEGRIRLPPRSRSGGSLKNRAMLTLSISKPNLLKTSLEMASIERAESMFSSLFKGDSPTQDCGIVFTCKTTSDNTGNRNIRRASLPEMKDTIVYENESNLNTAALQSEAKVPKFDQKIVEALQQLSSHHEAGKLVDSAKKDTTKGEASVNSELWKSRLRGRRATVHHTTQNHNWKDLASSFIGMTPTIQFTPPTAFFSRQHALPKDKHRRKISAMDANRSA